MKKVIVLLVIMLILVGCAQAPDNQEGSTNDSITTTDYILSENTTETTIEATETEQNEAEINCVEIQHCFDYEYDIVPSSEAAVDLATVVFKHIEKTEEAQNYTLSEVFFIDDTETWVVLFSDTDWWQAAEGKSGYCNISIDKKTGEIVSLFFKKTD